jgi:hypothetical protein
MNKNEKKSTDKTILRQTKLVGTHKHTFNIQISYENYSLAQQLYFYPCTPHINNLLFDLQFFSSSPDEYFIKFLSNEIHECKEHRDII